MSNPKDWFRRRRRDAVLPSTGAEEDPFESGTVLELDGGVGLLGNAGRRSTAIDDAGASVSQKSGEAVSTARKSVPPSLPRVSDLRTPPIADLQTFSVQPDSPTAAPDGATNVTLAALGVPWVRRSRGAGGASSGALHEAFTPTRPKQQGTNFCGRIVQMQRIISAIEEERAHVLLYGERGSGKTSLANILAIKAEEAGYFVVKFSCSSELDFDDLFRSLLRRIPATMLADEVGATMPIGVNNFEELLPPGEIRVTELVALFGRLHDKHAIFIVDEYDRITDEVTKRRLAELLKTMCDASVPATMLLIGVAEDVDALLGKHGSLRRALVTVPLPLMPAPEIDGIIRCGEERSGLRFAPEVRQRIVEFAQGLPYHAQLLCLFSACSALRRQSKTVERDDLRDAVLRAAEEAEGKVRNAYNLAAASPQGGSAFKDVLFAAALSAGDAFGAFSIADVANAAAARRIALSALSLPYPLRRLTEPARGMVLRRVDDIDGPRYQFASHMMRHHVLMRQAVERGLV
jgi:Cdc6-like AAA superfamily ATPase